MKLFLEWFSFASLGYFVVLNAVYLAFTLVAWRGISRHRRAQLHSGDDEILASPLTPGVSILLPAYNEEAGIVDSVRSLLALRYPRLEVVVVSDGSTDGTIEQLARVFDLAPATCVFREEIPFAAVRATYRSRRNPALLVVDKGTGGKADALNCGLSAATHPYVCAIDADTVLEEDALLRVIRPVLDDPELVVATGGIVRIANGCLVDHGRVMEVRLPRSRLAAIQVVEYFRAFLVGRMGWNSIGSLLIISGAFGLFRRSAVEAVGGWDTKNVGEDVELVVRLHRHFREQGDPYRIEFVPDPVCWTEAPEDIRTLGRQRRRWQRGLAETLWRHRRLIGNPRYGTLGLVALPYFLVLELIGPVFAIGGLPATLVGVALGTLSTTFLFAFLAVSWLLGTLLSVAALALEELSFRRHERHADVVRMLYLSAVENIGYRVLNDVWRLLGLVDALRRKRGWGAMAHRGLGSAPAGAVPVAEATDRLDRGVRPELVA